MAPPPLLLKTIGTGLNLLHWVAPQLAAKQAYRLFTRPPRPRLRDKELAFLATAERRDTIRAGLACVEYHWGAPGPVVLLSYGWGYNSGRWRHFVPALVEAGFHIIAYDPPGHGQAPRGQLNLVQNGEILRELIAAYGRPYAFIGHSFGGAAAVYGLAGLPATKLPDKMVIMASFSDARSVFRVFQRDLGLGTPLYWSFVQYIKRIARAPLRSFDLAVAAGRHLAGVPALVVHDRADALTPVAHAHRYFAYWPGCALYTPRGTGHHLGKPRVTEAIIHYVVDGSLPTDAQVQRRPLPVEHDLVRYFASLGGPTSV